MAPKARKSAKTAGKENDAPAKGSKQSNGKTTAADKLPPAAGAAGSAHLCLFADCTCGTGADGAPARGPVDPADVRRQLQCESPHCGLDGLVHEECFIRMQTATVQHRKKTKQKKMEGNRKVDVLCPLCLGRTRDGLIDPTPKAAPAPTPARAPAPAGKRKEPAGQRAGSSTSGSYGGSGGAGALSDGGSVGGGAGTGASRDFDGSCRFCSRAGHWQSDCPIGALDLAPFDIRTFLPADRPGAYDGPLSLHAVDTSALRGLSTELQPVGVYLLKAMAKLETELFAGLASMVDRSRQQQGYVAFRPASQHRDRDRGLIISAGAGGDEGSSEAGPWLRAVVHVDGSPTIHHVVYVITYEELSAREHRGGVTDSDAPDRYAWLMGVLRPGELYAAVLPAVPDAALGRAGAGADAGADGASGAGSARLLMLGNSVNAVAQYRACEEALHRLAGSDASGTAMLAALASPLAAAAHILAAKEPCAGLSERDRLVLRHDRGLTLLLGPPGTGKSYQLVASTADFLGRIDRSRGCLLLTSNTNQAINELAAKLTRKLAPGGAGAAGGPAWMRDLVVLADPLKLQKEGCEHSHALTLAAHAGRDGSVRAAREVVAAAAGALEALKRAAAAGGSALSAATPAQSGKGWMEAAPARWATADGLTAAGLRTLFGEWQAALEAAARAVAAAAPAAGPAAIAVRPMQEMLAAFTAYRPLGATAAAKSWAIYLASALPSLRDAAGRLEDAVCARVLQTARVFLSTADMLCLAPFARAAGGAAVGAAPRVHTLMVDEAACVPEPALAALVASYAPEHTMLVGDPKQNHPFSAVQPALFVRAPGLKAALTVSALERLSRLAPAATMQLDVQYRMHPALGTVVSEIFYEAARLKRIRAAEGLAARLASARPQLDRYAAAGPGRLRWVETGAAESRQGCSWANFGEAEEAVAQAAAALAVDPQASVLLISPYDAQKERLEQALRQRIAAHEAAGEAAAAAALRAVRALTVSKVQGEEADVVIVTYVRSSHEAHQSDIARLFAEEGREHRGASLEFVRGVQAATVALSRARHLLVVLGSRATMQDGAGDDSQRLWSRIIAKFATAPALTLQRTAGAAAPGAVEPLLPIDVSVTDICRAVCAGAAGGHPAESVGRLAALVRAAALRAAGRAAPAALPAPADEASAWQLEFAREAVAAAAEQKLAVKAVREDTRAAMAGGSAHARAAWVRAQAAGGSVLPRTVAGTAINEAIVASILDAVADVEALPAAELEAAGWRLDRDALRRWIGPHAPAGPMALLRATAATAMDLVCDPKLPFPGFSCPPLARVQEASGRHAAELAAATEAFSWLRPARAGAVGALPPAVLRLRALLRNELSGLVGAPYGKLAEPALIDLLGSCCARVQAAEELSALLPAAVAEPAGLLPRLRGQADGAVKAAWGPLAAAVTAAAKRRGLPRPDLGALRGMLEIKSRVGGGRQPPAAFFRSQDILQAAGYAALSGGWAFLVYGEVGAAGVPPRVLVSVFDEGLCGAGQALPLDAQHAAAQAPAEWAAGAGTLVVAALSPGFCARTWSAALASLADMLLVARVVASGGDGPAFGPAARSLAAKWEALPRDVTRGRGALYAQILAAYAFRPA